MTNELTGWLQTATGAIEQMQRAPISLLLIGVLIVCGAVLKSMELFPNRLIPAVVLLLGGVGNGFLGDPGSVSNTQRHPEAVLVLQGILLGFAAWALHHFLLRRLERFIPFLAGKSGDTVTINKKDTTE